MSMEENSFERDLRNPRLLSKDNFNDLEFSGIKLNESSKSRSRKSSKKPKKNLDIDLNNSSSFDNNSKKEHFLRKNEKNRK